MFHCVPYAFGDLSGMEINAVSQMVCSSLPIVGLCANIRFEIRYWGAYRTKVDFCVGVGD